MPAGNASRLPVATSSTSRSYRSVAGSVDAAATSGHRFILGCSGRCRANHGYGSSWSDRCVTSGLAPSQARR